MKIDAINFGAFTPQTQQIQDGIKAEKTSSPSPLDTYDETRFAKEQPASNPIAPQGTVEDLINMQESTEQMARSYGFPSVAAAVEATSPASTSGGESMSIVSAVSGSSASSVNQ